MSRIKYAYDKMQETNPAIKPIIDRAILLSLFGFVKTTDNPYLYKVNNYSIHRGDRYRCNCPQGDQFGDAYHFTDLPTQPPPALKVCKHIAAVELIVMAGIEPDPVKNIWKMIERVVLSGYGACIEHSVELPKVAKIRLIKQKTLPNAIVVKMGGCESKPLAFPNHTGRYVLADKARWNYEVWVGRIQALKNDKKT